MKQLKQLEGTIEQKIAKLDREGSETLEALLTTNTLTDASKILKISRNGVYDRINKYKLDEIINDLKAKSVLALTQASVDASENLTNKIKSRDEKVSIQASTEILDRIGIVKPQRTGGEINLNFNNLATAQKADYDL